MLIYTHKHIEFERKQCLTYFLSFHVCVYVRFLSLLRHSTPFLHRHNLWLQKCIDCGPNNYERCRVQRDHKRQYLRKQRINFHFSLYRLYGMNRLFNIVYKGVFCSDCTGRSECSVFAHNIWSLFKHCSRYLCFCRKLQTIYGQGLQT